MTPPPRTTGARSLVDVPGTPCSCPTRGTSARRSCSPRSGSRPWHTSGGFAATRGRLDGAMTRDEVLDHAGELARASTSRSRRPGELLRPRPAAWPPPSRRPRAGLAAAPWRTSGRPDEPIYETALAAERVPGRAEAAHGGPILRPHGPAENYLHGRRTSPTPSLRLQAYQEAGADVLSPAGGRPGRAAPAAGRGRPPGERARAAGRAHVGELATRVSRSPSAGHRRRRLRRRRSGRHRAAGRGHLRYWTWPPCPAGHHRRLSR